MDRRAFGISAVCFGVVSALKAQQCAMIAPGVAGCRVSIALPQVALAATLQHCPEWCWAASTSAMFKFFGHDVAQEDIVKAAYGQIACMPALRPIQIAQALSRKWTDSDGDDFRLRITAAYDPSSNLLAINNAIVVNEVASGRPLIYCNTHHCMVICSVDYRPTQMGPVIDGITVVDPWPYSPTIHALSAAEMRPIHLGGQ